MKDITCREAPKVENATDPFYLVPPTVFAVWAKHDRQSGSYMPLPQHCADAAAVARILWDEGLAPATRGIVERALGDSAELAQKLAVFLASAHDIGKASPAFAGQLPSQRDRMEAAGYIFTPTLSELERRRLPHSLVSHIHLTSWLKKKFPDARLPIISSIAIVLGGHHGVFPAPEGVQALTVASRGFGNKQWYAARESLLEKAQLTARLSDKELHEIVSTGLDQPSQLVLTGFVIQCDWIASNVDLFPYQGTSAFTGHHLQNSSERALRALHELDLPQPWRPNAPDADKVWAARFNLPPKALPRPIQRAMLDVARKATTPGFFILEAPTGEGKTEAALAAAEVLAQRFGCGGLMIALPTQATSDALFARTLAWLRRTVPPEESASVALSHGKAEFNEDYTHLRFPNTRDVYDDSLPSQPALRAHWWQSGRKKSVLADFVVGTIDQVLFAALVSRHLMLRYLGLSGKVVILDEVHAADEYMQIYLDRALEWLGALNVPVIALSATLPPHRRAAMLNAYQCGRGDALETRNQTASVAETATQYPIITTTDTASITPERSSRSIAARVELFDEDPAGLADLAIKRTTSGGCVAIIHNTVDRAQQTYLRLREALGDDVVLLHSRFMTEDRLALETALRKKLGPLTTGEQRPQRLVVVATQVIEQSLDLDFDLMISDLAPIDSLIQRLGRLHRHDRPSSDRPAGMAEPELIVTGLSTADSVPTFVTGSSRVYGNALLFRTLAVLANRIGPGGTLTSPDDVALLVRDAYDPELSCPSGWEESWQAAELDRSTRLAEQHQRASSGCVQSPRKGARALLGWSDSASDASDDQTARRAVRDTDDAIEVVLVQRGNDGRAMTLPWLDRHASEYVDLGPQIAPDLARAIARCTLRLPGWVSSGRLGDQIIEELEDNFFSTWQDSPWLKGVLALVVSPDLTAKVAGQVFRYDRHLGLVIEKGEKA
ncbi:CRISPR-associated helicase/endonuclease Cas3 [Brooklawnia cerclae]|uniref:CRISPR-associated endonuclease/helicase Cas3 n=1 Tax=Brooklawnia cerclae TaxID=349934 RepID=A0ABX0SGZ4_9ACTN|nr:CRISPR-associated endonuclease/helicase Cas3 [Brooklawnia cerclae]